MTASTAARLRARVAGSSAIARLAFRRALPYALVAAFVALLALVVWREHTQAETLAESKAGLGALQRRSAWSLFVWIAVPNALFMAAGVCRRWSRSEGRWFGALPVSHAEYLLALWIGVWFATLALLGATALAAEAGAGSNAGLRRLQQELPHPRFALVQGDSPRVWPLTGMRLDAGQYVRLRPTVAPGSGPAVTVLVRLLQGPDGPELARVERRVSGRTSLELEVPAATESPWIEVARLGTGAVLAVPGGSLTLLDRIDSARELTFALALQLALASGVWTALVLALGSWLRPALAIGATLALFAWSTGSTPLPALESTLRWLPGTQLPDLWQRIGEGLVPVRPGPTNWVVGLAAIASSLILAARGLSRGQA